MSKVIDLHMQTVRTSNTRGYVPDNRPVVETPAARSGERMPIENPSKFESVERPWQDGETLRELYVEKDLSQYEIADLLDCTQVTISNWMQRHDIDRGREPTPWRDEEYMRRLYIDQGLEAKEIAEALQCSNGTVEKWLSIHSIYNIDTSQAPPELNDETWLKEQYQSSSIIEIADELGCAHSTVEKYLRRSGIETRGHPPIVPPLDDAETLHDWYIDRGLTRAEIGEKIGCSAWAVGHWLRKHNIPRRDAAHKREPQTGADHPRWNGGSGDYGQKWYLARKERLEIDDYECVICGLTMDQHREEYGEGLHIHHVIKKEEFRGEDGNLNEELAHDMDNLLTLCRKHHTKWEGIPLKPDCK